MFIQYLYVEFWNLVLNRKDSDINLLNAKLNPSCKSQLAEFFRVGI